MRTRTILASVLTVALFTLGTLCVTTAAAQTTDGVVGLQYDLNNASIFGQSTKLHGAAVDYDRPLIGDRLRLAAGGAFNYSETLNETFADAGPGVRHNADAFEAWAHALFGYRRKGGSFGSDEGFDARLAGGIDYPLGRRHGLRAGVAYEGDVHVTVGVGLRF